jgi:hypothetical protein
MTIMSNNLWAPSEKSCLSEILLVGSGLQGVSYRSTLNLICTVLSNKIMMKVLEDELEELPSSDSKV